MTAIAAPLTRTRRPGLGTVYRWELVKLQAQKRTAIALGLPEHLSGTGLLNAWREKLRNFKPIPPRTVSDGPVRENVMEGDAVDLDKFPTPMWHAHDGGRYIGTGVSSGQSGRAVAQ